MKEIQTKAGKIVVLSIKDIIDIERPDGINLGMLSEFTDSDCEGFVEYYPQPIGVYRNYIGGLDQAWDCGNSAKKSFLSLLQSEDIDTNRELIIIKLV